MKRLAFVAALSVALAAAPAAGQVALYGGGGAAFPTGDDLDGVDAGLQLFGGATFDVSEKVSLYAEGQWGTHSLEASDDVTVKPSALMAGLILGLGSDEDAPVSPYLFAGGGIQTVNIDPDTGEGADDSTFGFQLGAGLGFDLAGIGAFAEGRYQRASFADDAAVLPDATFAIFSVAVGLSVELGGG